MTGPAVFSIAQYYFAGLIVLAACVLHALPGRSRRDARLAPRRSLGLRFRLLQIGPFFLLAAIAFDLRRHWDRIPSRFPIHWDFNGRPNRWTTRSIHGVFGPLFVAAVLCGALTLVIYATVHWSRRIGPGSPVAEKEDRVRRHVASILLAAQYMVTLIFSWVALLPLRSSPTANAAQVTWVLIGELAFIVIIVALCLRAGRGGSARSASDAVRASVPAFGLPGNRTEDRFWKAGLFYVNRDDPAVVVAKRFGIGYTFNWAHPRAWMILAAVIAAPLLVAFIVTRSH